MARIWYFHLENLLKNCVVTVNNRNNDSVLYSIMNKERTVTFAFVSGDTLLTSVAQLKLNDSEYKIWLKYLEDNNLI